MVLRYWGSRSAGGTVLPGPHPGWPLSPAHPAVHAGYTRPAAGQVSGLGWEEEGFEERELDHDPNLQIPTAMWGDVDSGL